MLDELVGCNIILRVGVVEELLLIRISVCRVDITILTHTVCRTILQYVDDTTGTYACTTCTLVTTEDELRVELECEVSCELSIQLCVDVGTANTRTEDDTLVLRVCERYIELNLVRTTTNGNVSRVVQRSLVHNFVLPVV